MVIPLLIAGLLTLIALAAERVHALRVSRVVRLAFGSGARPALWARSAPVVRVLGVLLASWGAMTLLSYDPVENFGRPTRQASKQLLICLDVSPSMMLKDSGPGSEKVSRGQWAGKVAQGILDRLDTETTRVTLYGFYTSALPIVKETFDKEVISNALDGLPMYVAFEPGPTDVRKGVSKALEAAKVWPSRSAMLVVLSDGDSSGSSAPVSLPDSIADVIVIGVGDPYRSTMINGHGSRQDADSLKNLAAQLKGLYHNGNEKHLPSSILDNLTLTSPRSGTGIGLREAGIGSLFAGSSMLALIGPLLVLFGRPRSFKRSRSRVLAAGQHAPTEAAA